MNHKITVRPVLYPSTLFFECASCHIKKYFIQLFETKEDFWDFKDAVFKSRCVDDHFVEL